MAAPGAAPPRLALALAVVAALVAVKYYRDSEAARQQVTEGARRGEARRSRGPRCPSRKWRADTAAARLRGQRGLEAGTGVEVAVAGLRGHPQPPCRQRWPPGGG